MITIIVISNQLNPVILIVKNKSRGENIMIKGIVCVDKNWAIGKDNDLLFKLSKDMQFFKETTLNHIVFCGRKTLESFPKSKPLPKRSTICLCSPQYNRDDCYCINSIEDAIKLIKELAKTQTVFVIGGATLYKTMLPYYDEIYVTKVDADGEGTAFFPNLTELPEFELVNQSETFSEADYRFSFCTYKKVGC